ncbi:Gentisate 1,2-dioxygenase [Klebsiella oxytoca]|nr:Gentisate 1,2-dioxygenase [Klebsiella oxytoca]
MSQSSMEINNDRQNYYQHISGQNLTPLWESLHHLVPKTPNPTCAPAYWNYQEIRPLLLKKRRADWRERGDTPRTGAGEPGAARTVIDYFIAVCRFTADHARRSGAEPPS